MAAAKGNCYNPDGRPPKDFDWVQFEELCYLQCTQEEIANVLKTTKETLIDAIKRKYNQDFPTVYKRFSAGGKMSLRRTQFKLAQKNTAMAIWLGKNYLDQKENQPVQIVTEEILINYEQMIHQLRALQAKAAPQKAEPETSTNS